MWKKLIIPFHAQQSYTLYSVTISQTAVTLCCTYTRKYRKTMGRRDRNTKRQRRLAASLLGVTAENNNRDHKIIVTVLLHLLWSYFTPCHTVLDVSMSDCTLLCRTTSMQRPVGVPLKWSECVFTEPRLPDLIVFAIDLRPFLQKVLF